MKICILICGLKRSIDLVLQNIDTIFRDYDYEIIISTDNNINNNLSEYNYNNKIIKYIFLKNIYDNLYRNSLNYSYKLNNGIKLIDNNYDLYIIIRTDLIINNIDLKILNDNINSNKLYFSNKNVNQFTKNIINKINDNIIITKNYNLLKTLENIHEYIKYNNNYFDITLYNYLHLNNIEYDLIDIDYKLILLKCNIISIAGDSGSGKTTLMNALKPLFEDDNVLTLETDRYHKWERGDKNYLKYTHLNPEANHLEKMYEDVYNLKIGNEIYQVDYDHSSGKFTQKEKIKSKDNLILCGLHTMYDSKMKNISNINIYIDTDRNLMKKWKIQRDVYERGYTMEKVLEQIKIREKDYNEYISVQIHNSDIIINFYNDDETNTIQCNLKIINKDIINKIIKHLIKLNYNISIENDILIIKLMNNIDILNIIDDYILYIFDNNVNLFKSNYYKEIFYILYIYLYI